MLNPQQQNAVNYVSGPLLVIAGAGSGKTRVITEKIAKLITKYEYKPNQIFAVTFTNKAANEMQARIGQVLAPKYRRGLKISTFHTLGLNIIKKNYDECELRRGFTIFDSEDGLQIIKKLITDGKAKDQEYINNAQKQISLWKNDLLTPCEVKKQFLNHEYDDDMLSLYDQYQTALKAYNAVDFDDLILLPVILLTQNDEIRQHWQNKIKYLLVDEYQDSNIGQYNLVKLLVGDSAQFTVVGDDDQSIYAWRGAKPENLAKLQHDFPKLEVIKLEQNYRSTEIILESANHLIQNNDHIFEKKLWSNIGKGELLKVLHCKDENDEADQVVMNLISHKIKNNTQYGHYSILYRGNHQSRIFEKMLRHYSIPYQISGGQSWFGRSEIKDFLAYIRLIVNPDDNPAFLRVINTPKRNIGDKTIQKIGDYAHTHQISLFKACDASELMGQVADKTSKSLHDFKSWIQECHCRVNDGSSSEKILNRLLNQSGYEAYLYEVYDTASKARKRMDNIFELIQWIIKISTENNLTLAEAINKLILIDMLDQADEQSEEHVKLMTLHASKGLEFPYVYLTGMEEDLLPHKNSIETDSIAEERRLTYVGITRAQLELMITLARYRKKNGEITECQPSRFIAELPEKYVKNIGKLQNPQESEKIAKSHLTDLKKMLSTD